MCSVFERLRKHRDAQYTQDMKDARDVLSFAMEMCEVQRQARRKFSLNICGKLIRGTRNA